MVVREEKLSELSADSVEKGAYAHYMLKEIHEQACAVAQTLSERIAGGKLQRFGRCDIDLWTCQAFISGIIASPYTTPGSRITVSGEVEGLCITVRLANRSSSAPSSA